MLQAVAASSVQRARQYAGAHGILHVADSYQALLERDGFTNVAQAVGVDVR